MKLKPLPTTGFPIAATFQPTLPWQQWFADVDQALQAGSMFEGPEATRAQSTGQTLTAGELLAGVLLRSGPAGAFSDTTPTAEEIVAAIPKAAIGTNRIVMIRNGGGGLMTLLAGAGVTLQGTTTIAAGNGRFYLIKVTAKAAGSEAVSIRGLITGAM